MWSVSFDPAALRHSYDRIAARYAAEFDDELSHRPLERALLAALAELACLDKSPGLVADLGAGPDRSLATCGRRVCRRLPSISHPPEVPLKSSRNSWTRWFRIRSPSAQQPTSAG